MKSVLPEQLDSCGLLKRGTNQLQADLSKPLERPDDPSLPHAAVFSHRYQVAFHYPGKLTSIACAALFKVDSRAVLANDLVLARDEKTNVAEAVVDSRGEMWRHLCLREYMVPVLLVRVTNDLAQIGRSSCRER